MGKVVGLAMAPALGVIIVLCCNLAYCTAPSYPRDLRSVSRRVPPGRTPPSHGHRNIYGDDRRRSRPSRDHERRDYDERHLPKAHPCKDPMKKLSYYCRKGRHEYREHDRYGVGDRGSSSQHSYSRRRDGDHKPQESRRRYSSHGRRYPYESPKTNPYRSRSDERRHTRKPIAGDRYDDDDKRHAARQHRFNPYLHHRLRGSEDSLRHRYKVPKKSGDDSHDQRLSDGHRRQGYGGPWSDEAVGDRRQGHGRPWSDDTAGDRRQGHGRPWSDEKDGRTQQGHSRPWVDEMDEDRRPSPYEPSRHQSFRCVSPDGYDRGHGESCKHFPEPKPGHPNPDRNLVDAQGLPLVYYYTNDICPKTPNYEDPWTGKKYLVATPSSGCFDMSYFDALNFCQSVGMQAVTLDSKKSEKEKRDVLKLADDLGLKSFWTSGFVGKEKWGGAVRTLTWTSSSIPADEEVEPGTGFWSRSGPDGRPQPDNYAYRRHPRPENRESCVVVLNNWYGDGIALHDEKCSRSHPVVCEQASWSFQYI